MLLKHIACKYFLRRIEGFEAEAFRSAAVFSAAGEWRQADFSKRLFSMKADCFNKMTSGLRQTSDPVGTGILIGRLKRLFIIILSAGGETFFTA